MEDDIKLIEKYAEDAVSSIINQGVSISQQQNENGVFDEEDHDDDDLGDGLSDLNDEFYQLMDDFENGQVNLMNNE